MAVGDRVTGASFESFAKAPVEAFEKIPGDQAEGFAAAKVVQLSMEKGGIVGDVQFKVELESTH
jgi:hypothetical protein